MIWVVVVCGLALAAFGATAGAALITVSRAELTRAVGHRLRGGTPTLESLAQIDDYLTAASATTSLGVLVVGAAIPSLVAGIGPTRAVVILPLVAMPIVLFVAYLGPRWLTEPRAESVADRVVPMIMTSAAAAQGWQKPVRLLWIDGDHRYASADQTYSASQAPGIDVQSNFARTGGFAHCPASGSGPRPRSVGARTATPTP